MNNPEEMNEEELYEYARGVQEAMLRLTDAMQVLVETDDMETFRDNMSVEDCGLCILCAGSAVLRDALNIPWCSQHRDRGEFVSLMAHRRWQGIKNAPMENEDGHVSIHSVESGAWFIANVVLGGSDEAITALALEAMQRAWPLYSAS
jgi:hypothetical protein